MTGGAHDSKGQDQSASSLCESMSWEELAKRLQTEKVALLTRLVDPSCADVDRLASAAFEWDRRNGHHKGGPWTWHMIGGEGQENYRGLVRAVLAELIAISHPGSLDG